MILQLKTFIRVNKVYPKCWLLYIYQQSRVSQNSSVAPGVILKQEGWSKKFEKCEKIAFIEINYHSSILKILKVLPFISILTFHTVYLTLN